MQTVTTTRAALEVVLLSWTCEEQRAGRLGDDVTAASVASAMIAKLWPMLEADERRRVMKAHGLAGSQR